MSEPYFRPATLDDAELAADLITAARPDFPADPEGVRYDWQHPRTEWRIGRFIAELDRKPIAFVGWSHGPWEQVPHGNCEAEVWLDKTWLDPELLASLWQWVAAQAEADGARLIEAYAGEDAPETLEVLDRLGFRRDRVERLWELDFAVHGKRLVAEAKAARAKAQEAGIKMVTLADWSDPDSLKKVHALGQLTRRDVPTTFGWVLESYESWVERVSGPDKRQDRFWIARHGSLPVAYSYLRFPPVRGQVWTGYTCSHPEYRGRGIARAVKLQSLAQAVALGIPLVLTSNDSENAPMLHINETLGYHRQPGFVSLVKRVET